jgi:hypothetical protein
VRVCVSVCVYVYVCARVCVCVHVRACVRCVRVVGGIIVRARVEMSRLEEGERRRNIRTSEPNDVCDNE